MRRRKANSMMIHPRSAYDILSFQKERYPCPPSVSSVLHNCAEKEKRRSAPGSAILRGFQSTFVRHRALSGESRTARQVGSLQETLRRLQTKTHRAILNA